jgi:hypothetical protein
MQHFEEQLRPLEEPLPVHRTFIHFQLPCPGSAARRCHSQPCNELVLDSARSLSESLPRHTQSDSCLQRMRELAPKQDWPLQDQEDRVRLWSDELPVDSEEEEEEHGALECPAAPPTPSPRYPVSGRRETAWGTACHSQRPAAAWDREGHGESKCQASRATVGAALHDSSMPSCRKQLMCPDPEAFPHTKALPVRPFLLSTPSPLYGNMAASRWLPALSPEKSTPVSVERPQVSDSPPCTQLRYDEPPCFPRFTMPIGRGPSVAARVLQLACIV